jgi:nucleoside-diphosphate-sugar epimerase
MPEPTIPKDSWVLVTGANGFVGTHVILQFLERGYKVRGTVRDAKVSKWVTEEVFPQYAKDRSLEVVEVKDMAATNAFDEAVKGVEAVVHIATITTFDPDPSKVIPPTVAGTVSAFSAALKEPGVKRFVYTTSIVAAAMLQPGDEIVVGRDTWNELAVQLANAPPPYDANRALSTYCASKVEAEKELWSLVETRRPHFEVNTVSPATVFGAKLHKSMQGKTADWVAAFYNGDKSPMSFLPTCK